MLERLQTRFGLSIAAKGRSCRLRIWGNLWGPVIKGKPGFPRGQGSGKGESHALPFPSLRHGQDGQRGHVAVAIGGGGVSVTVVLLTTPVKLTDVKWSENVIWLGSVVVLSALLVS